MTLRVTTLQKVLLKRLFITSSVTSPKLETIDDIPGPGGLPFFGSWFKYKFNPSLREHYHENLISMKNQYGDILKETISGQTIVHLFDPDDFHVVYSHAQKIPHTTPLIAPSKHYRIKRKLGLGLGNMNGTDWRKIRSAIQPVLMRHQASFTFLPLVREVVNEFVDRVQRLVKSDGHVDNFKNELLRWNIESGFNVFMGARLRCFNDDMDARYQAMIDVNARVFDITNRLNYSLGVYHCLPTPSWMNHVRAEDLYFGLADEILQRSLTEACQPETDKSRFPFLLHLLTKPDITPDHIKTLSISSTFDGLNTTVPSVIGQLYCLATNPDHQQQLYEEIINILPSRTTSLTLEHLNKMPYLKLCLKEGLRFFPIGSEITRVPTNDVVIRGCRIPAGTRIDLHMAAMLRDAKYFSQPDAYIPERWSRDSRHGQPINPYASIPFGFGTRMCVAKKVAELEMQVLTVQLIRNFRILWRHEAQMKQIHKVLLFPDMEPDFTFIARER